MSTNTPKQYRNDEDLEENWEKDEQQIGNEASASEIESDNESEQEQTEKQENGNEIYIKNVQNLIDRIAHFVFLIFIFCF
jgi:hypothetical protein